MVPMRKMECFGLALRCRSLRDPTVYDEMSADGVKPRAHWARFIESFQEFLGHRSLTGQTSIVEFNSMIVLQQ
jgi:hypothetical protein